MNQIDTIAERIRQSFETRTQAREQALARSRTLIRFCANAIRAAHRDERDLAASNLKEAEELAKVLRSDLAGFPDLYYSGYSQDALKEFAEATIVYNLLDDGRLPTPEELGLEPSTYLQGLAEAAGELRRRCLDLLRQENPAEAERFLNYMDDIYAVLITMDYPDAITGGLRRLTDIVRSLNERTRGDITNHLSQQHLEHSMRRLETLIAGESKTNPAD